MLGVEVEIRVSSKFVKFLVEHADDLGRLVVDDFGIMLVPKDWNRILAVGIVAHLVQVPDKSAIVDGIWDTALAVE